MTDFEGRLRAALQDETSRLVAKPDLVDDMLAQGGRARRRRHVVGAAAAVALLVAVVPVWRSIDTSSEPLPPTHRPTVVTPPPSVHTPIRTTPTGPSAWATTAVDVTRSPSSPPEVTDLRVGQHTGYDRVVIDLTGELSGYRVRYVSGLRFDASGAAVPLAGPFYIQISLTPATAHDAQGHSIYQGPHLTKYTMPTLRGVANTGDFEGVVSFGLSLGHRAGFRVSSLSSPTRLVIDLQH